MITGLIVRYDLVASTEPVPDYFNSVRTYNSSTFFLAQGVLRRNFRLDLMLGSLVKHLTVMIFPNSSQP